LNVRAENRTNAVLPSPDIPDHALSVTAIVVMTIIMAIVVVIVMAAFIVIAVVAAVAVDRADDAGREREQRSGDEQDSECHWMTPWAREPGGVIAAGAKILK
jgi:heme/copper-type cytochrome/quinol oxidase subunit 2